MSQSNSTVKIAVIGAGVAGSSAALYLAEQGLNVTLIEQGNALVNGPPVCHLHAGGSLYREISDEQCLSLLEQSLYTFASFPQAVKIRPTVITVPNTDPGEPEELLPRLALLTEHYRQLVAKQPELELLGKVEDYCQLFSKEDLLSLKGTQLNSVPQSNNDWLVAFANNVDLESIKYPVVLVQEYGVSVFRVAASCEMAAAQLPNLQVRLNTRVTEISQSNQGWHLQLTNSRSDNLYFDYVVNACGFRSGEIDDKLGIQRQRFVEFKAAYITKWQNNEHWPEVVFHGERGTINGMAQLTPYADGYFQLHGMTAQVTLFDDGLVNSGSSTAQPQLAQRYIDKIKQGWPEQVVVERTQQAIAHMSRYVPAFHHAQKGGKPLFGAQQIPGNDPSLRSSLASFTEHNYARSEIVKLSSALPAAKAIYQDLFDKGLVKNANVASVLKSNKAFSTEQIIQRAAEIAIQRGYPEALAK
ncbi:FAD-dependent oxidoreductase [Paraferrimonas sp. SM1919]|uniref:FAD-dependent oxidoreductase n=1 Tax=Paraferrimonas sp. SM1919 TaxID=2662263 RepID=UPI0013D2BB85|nr:FAD-dependent oxidoreductase [Paraferrimonas sp. SM1919]